MKVRLITILFVLLTVTNAWHIAWGDETGTTNPLQKTVKITISPETTYITEPLLPDGRVDYIGALNRMLSEGVTPENNIYAGVFMLLPGEMEIAVFYARRDGHELSGSQQKYREKYFEMLGLGSPPDLDTLRTLSPPGTSDVLDNSDPYQQLLRFYPKEEIDAKIETRKSKKADEYRNQYEDGKINGERLAEMLQSLEEENFRKFACRDIIFNEHSNTRDRIFTEDEYPYIADWMKSTADLADKLIEISHRTRSYNPVVRTSDDQSMFDILLPYVQTMREIARHLQIRGNWHFGRGEYDEAMECAFASLRNSFSLRSNSGTAVEEVVGVAMGGIASQSIANYLGHLETKKDAAWIRAKQQEYRAICERGTNRTPLPIWLIGEYLMNLSELVSMTYQLEYMKETFRTLSGSEEELMFLKKCYDPDYDYDWDKVLKRINTFWAEVEDIMLIPDTMRRIRAMERLDVRLPEKAQYIKNMVVTADMDRERLLADFIHCTRSPSLNAVLYAIARIECQTQMTDIVFSVAAWRCDHGEFPETLDVLVPEYLDRVPESLYTNKPMRYLKRAGDVLLVNDETFLLDGSEAELEKKIADAPVGDYVFPMPRSFILILHKE